MGDATYPDLARYAVDPALAQVKFDISQLSRDLGFTEVQVLYIANNFGDDWVNKGYPAVKGK